MTPLLLLAITLQAPSAEKLFFNGKDLDGWVNVNCAPNTFVVKDGEIVTTGTPTGYMRTAKQYENFTCEFEWMHTRKDGKAANSGFFVWADALPALGNGYTRGIEVQVLCDEQGTCLHLGERDGIVAVIFLAFLIIPEVDRHPPLRSA